MKRTETRAFAVLLFAALSAWTTLTGAAERQVISAADFGALPFMVGPNVPLSQSKKLHEALTKAKKPHSYLVYEGEGHGFDKPENAVAFLDQVDQFLRTHNPAN